MYGRSFWDVWFCAGRYDRAGGLFPDGRARSGKIDQDRLLEVLAVEDLSGAQ